MDKDSVLLDIYSPGNYYIFFVAAYYDLHCMIDELGWAQKHERESKRLWNNKEVLECIENLDEYK